MEQNGNLKPNQRKSKSPRRPCLCCGAAFLAEGPFIRLCANCKAGEDWQSGADFALLGREAANDN